MMDLSVMGGWLQLEHGVDVHSIAHAWEGLRVDVPMGRTYLPAIALTAPDKVINSKWSFYVLADQAFLPDRYTDSMDSEYVKLDALFAGRIDAVGLDSELGRLYRFANKLLAEALVFLGSGHGLYSLGQKEEWEYMVRGHLKRAGVEILEAVQLPGGDRDAD